MIGEWFLMEHFNRKSKIVLPPKIGSPQQDGFGIHDKVNRHRFYQWLQTSYLKKCFKKTFWRSSFQILGRMPPARKIPPVDLSFNARFDVSMAK